MKGETQAQTQDSYLSTKAISKGFLSTAAVFKYSELEEVADQFVSHLLLPSLWYLVMTKTLLLVL